MTTLLHDLRMAARSLRRAPGFTMLALLTLALGIGATTAVFTLLDRVVLRPLPYPEPERMVALVWRWTEQGGNALTPWQYQYWAEHSRSFSAVATMQGARLVLSGDGPAESLRALRVSPGYFRATGVQPVRGRGFTAEEDRPGGAAVVVLSDAFWRSHLAADAGVLGRTLTLDGQPHTVVGVMPPEADAPQLLTPLRLVADPRDGGSNYVTVARMAPGVSRAQAEAEMRALSERFRREHPRNAGERGHMTLQDYGRWEMGGLTNLAWLLFGAAGFFLLIACANVANLLLARVTARQGELAVRAALGAGRGRILRHLLGESLVLALLAAAVGAVLGAAMLRVLTAAAPAEITPLRDLRLNTLVLGFAVALSLAAGLAVGAVGAWRATRRDPADALRGQRRGQTASRAQGRARRVLVGAEAMLAVLLLVGAGLLIGTLYRLARVELGFRPQGVLTAELSVSPERFPNTAVTWSFERRVLEELAGAPGVAAAATASALPLGRPLNIPVEVGEPGAEQRETAVQYRAVSAEYFRALGVSALDGRLLGAEDRAGSAPVAVVNEAFARRFFAGRAAVGAALHAGAPPDLDDPARSIVGVVPDLRDIALQDAPTPTIFVPRLQVGDGLTRAMNGWFPAAVVVRATDADAAAAAIRRAVAAADPQVPLLRLRSLQELMSASVSLQRFIALLLGVFAGLALLLTAVGIYGTVAYAARLRTHEIGVRMALGARAEDVLRLVVAQGMRAVLVGLALGVVASLALTRLLGWLLYGVRPTDPLTFAAVALLLAGVALFASWLPARRAARVDPMVALRTE